MVSDKCLTAILGHKIGVDYAVKAHKVIAFLKNIKKEMLDTVPVISGHFLDRRKFSYLKIRPLLEYTLGLPDYQSFLEVIIPFFLIESYSLVRTGYNKAFRRWEKIFQQMSFCHLYTVNFRRYKVCI